MKPGVARPRELEERRLVAATMGSYLRDALDRDAAQEDAADWGTLGHIPRLRARVAEIYAEWRLDAMAYLSSALSFSGCVAEGVGPGLRQPEWNFPAIGVPR